MKKSLSLALVALPLTTLIACAAPTSEEPVESTEHALSKPRFAPTYRNFHELANIGLTSNGCFNISSGADQPITQQSCIVLHRNEGQWLDLGYGGDTGEAVEAYAGRAEGLRRGQRDWAQFGQKVIGPLLSSAKTDYAPGWTAVNSSWQDWNILGMDPEESVRNGDRYVVRTGCTAADWDPTNGHYWTHCDGWAEISWNYVYGSVPHKERHSNLFSFGLFVVSIIQCATSDYQSAPQNCAEMIAG